jgi:hypothetical protein
MSGRCILREKDEKHFTRRREGREENLWICARVGQTFGRWAPGNLLTQHHLGPIEFGNCARV